jgi:hypothetical protein
MRYVLALGAIALLAGSCNLWVALHDDGIVRGRVVQGDGLPVGEATVTFWEKTLTTLERRSAVRTAPDGSFVVVGQMAHHFALQASHDTAGESPRLLYRRHFRGENLVLAEPLRLSRRP